MMDEAIPIPEGEGNCEREPGVTIRPSHQRHNFNLKTTTVLCVAGGSVLFFFDLTLSLCSLTSLCLPPSR
jgi:hypothetical protein